MNKPITVLTRKGEEQLKNELNELRSVRRREVAEKIKVALSFGDLSENSEYDEAKNEQAILEAHIQELQYTIDNAEIVDDDSISVDEIGMSSKITIKRVDTGKIETFTIVGTNHANVREGLISDESPIGKALLGAKEGKTVHAETPGGTVELKILEIIK